MHAVPLLQSARSKILENEVSREQAMSLEHGEHLKGLPTHAIDEPIRLSQYLTHVVTPEFRHDAPSQGSGCRGFSGGEQRSHPTLSGGW